MCENEADRVGCTGSATINNGVSETLLLIPVAPGNSGQGGCVKNEAVSKEGGTGNAAIDDGASRTLLSYFATHIVPYVFDTPLTHPSTCLQRVSRRLFAYQVQVEYFTLRFCSSS